MKQKRIKELESIGGFNREYNAMLYGREYISGDIEIANNDGIAYMRTIDDSSVDMVLTDPPYVISRDTGFKNSVNGVDRLKISMDFGKWDKEFTIDMLSDVINEYHRVLRKGGYVIIFYDIWKIQELSNLLKGAGFKQMRFIEWIKTNPVPINSKINYLTNSREVAICAVKGSKPTFNSEYDNGVYSYPIYHSKDRFHPTQKPPDLFMDLIMKHTNVGDTVLDTFVGSGTTVVACMSTDRKCKSSERDNSYYRQTVRRVKEYGKQTTIPTE